MKLLTLSLLLALSLLLSSCSQEETLPFRDANAQEIQFFTPNWFQLATGYGQWAWDESVVKSNLDNDKDDEMLLFLDEWNTCENPHSGKVIAIDFDRKKNKWVKIWELSLSWNTTFPAHSLSHEITDMDKDGIQEIAIVSEESGCWSGWIKYKQILTIKDWKLVDISEWKLAVKDWSENMINTTANGYEIFEAIWNSDEGEAHFDCSRHRVRYYDWENWKLISKREYTTKYKYVLETDKRYNPNGESLTNQICITVDNFSTFLKYIRNDAVNNLYPFVIDNKSIQTTQAIQSIIQQDVNLRDSPSAKSKVMRPVIKWETIQVIGSLDAWGQTWFNVKTLINESWWISEVGFRKDDAVKSAADL